MFNPKNKTNKQTKPKTQRNIKKTMYTYIFTDSYKKIAIYRSHNAFNKFPPNFGKQDKAIG